MKTHRLVCTWSIILASVLLSNQSLLAAQEEPSAEKVQQEHQMLMEILSDLTQYGAALKGLTDSFFTIPSPGSSAPIQTDDQFKNISQQLLDKINTIKGKTLLFQQATQTNKTKKLLEQLASLSSNLAASQGKLNTVLQKKLGSPSLTTALKALGKTEEKKIQVIHRLGNRIDTLLKAYPQQKLKSTFDPFLKSIDYSLTFPQKNSIKAFNAALWHQKKR